MISQAIDKFVDRNDNVKKEDILYNSNNLTDKIQNKLSELLLDQLLPYANNMNEFKISLKSIVEIIETFGQKYNFLSDVYREIIFGSVSNNSSEIEAIRKECKNKKTLLNKIENNTKKAKHNNNNITTSSNIIKDKIKQSDGPFEIKNDGSESKYILKSNNKNNNHKENNERKIIGGINNLFTFINY